MVCGCALLQVATETAVLEANQRHEAAMAAMRRETEQQLLEGRLANEAELSATLELHVRLHLSFLLSLSVSLSFFPCVCLSFLSVFSFSSRSSLSACLSVSS